MSFISALRFSLRISRECTIIGTMFVVSYLGGSLIEFHARCSLKMLGKLLRPSEHSLLGHLQEKMKESSILYMMVNKFQKREILFPRCISYARGIS